MTNEFLLKQSNMKNQPNPLWLAGVVLFATTIFLTSCIEDNFEFDKITGPEINPTFALPLVKSRLTLNDILPEYDFIRTDTATGLVSLFFSSPQIISQTAEERMKVPDQLITVSETFLCPPLPFGEIYTYQFEVERGFTTEIPNQRFDEIVFRSGTVIVTIESYFDKNAVVALQIPNLINKTTGDTLELLFPMPYTGIQPGLISLQADLSPYLLHFIHPEPDSNSLMLRYTTTLEGDGSTTSSESTFITTVEFKEIRFESLIGYIGAYDFTFADSIDIGFLSNTIEGTLNLAPASIGFDIEIRNSYGLPIQLTIDPFHTVAQNRPQVNINLFGHGSPNSFTIQAPEQPGQTAVTQVETNSNLAEAISSLPDYIVFDITALTNPGNNLNDVNFILDNSRFEVDLTIQAELFGRVDALILRDTVEFNLDTEQADSLQLLVNITNTFPLNAALQIYFSDPEFQVLDSLFSNDTHLISGAPVGGGPDFRTTQPETKFTIVEVPPGKIENLAKSDHLIIVTTLSTTDNAYAKIYTEYYIEIELATKASLNIKP